MSEPTVHWKIHVKDYQVEVEVVGMEQSWVKEQFDVLASKYIPKERPEAVSAR